MAEISIRRLTPDDAGGYFALRRAMLLDAPLAFASSPEDDRASSVEAVAEILSKGPDNVVIGAFEGVGSGDPALIGAVGIYRDHHLKAAHKMHIWGMYVVPRRRGGGVGSRLVAAAIEHARLMPGVAHVQLSVSQTAPAARHIYERAGLVAWGREPDALRHEGHSADEWHMILSL